ADFAHGDVGLGQRRPPRTGTTVRGMVSCPSAHASATRLQPGVRKPRNDCTKTSEPVYENDRNGCTETPGALNCEKIASKRCLLGNEIMWRQQPHHPLQGGTFRGPHQPPQLPSRPLLCGSRLRSRRHQALSEVVGPG